VVVHPGAAHESRRWPADRFGAVAAWAHRGGRAVVVTGSAAERRLAERVASEAGLAASSVLAGQLGISDLAAVVSDADLVVCGDTGVAHLATAFRTPSVVLFGPTPPSQWGPPEDGPHVALWRGTQRGDPWGDAVDPALLQITPADVVAAAERLMSRVAANR
jgi:ADP-heptose:LPS heptosyltransferase